jgi:hypothetical protein
MGHITAVFKIMYDVWVHPDQGRPSLQTGVGERTKGLVWDAL